MAEAKKTGKKAPAEKKETAKKAVKAAATVKAAKTVKKAAATSTKKAAVKKVAAKPVKKLGKIVFEFDGQQIDFKDIEKKASKLGGNVYVVISEKKIYDADGNSVDLF